MDARLYDLLVAECGYIEPDAVASSSDVCANDLAYERADAIVEFIKIAKQSSLPNKLLPKELI